MNFLPRILPRNEEQRLADIHRRILRREAKIGGQIFGPLKKGHHREFFCLDQHTWIWYEEWVDASGKRQTVTTRYDVRSNGILKTQDGQRQQYLNGTELRNFVQAANLYYTKTTADLQFLLQVA